MTTMLDTDRPGRAARDAGPAGGRVRGLTRPEGFIPWLWFAAAVFFVAIPVWSLLWKSLDVEGSSAPGLENYGTALSRPDVLESILNSFIVAVATTIGALVIAVPFAVLVSRTNMPGSRFFRSVAVLTFAAPGFIAAMGWILLLGPRSGLLNQYVITPLGLPPFDIFSINGVVFCLVFFLYPLIFLPVVDALDNMDHRLEEASQSLGGGWWHTFRKVTLPLITPSVFSGSLLVFTGAFVIFGPVALLGNPVGFDTIPTAMFHLMMDFPPRLEYAAVLGLPVLVVLAGLLLLQRQLFGRRRFTTISGKPAERHIIDLGPWRYLIFFGGLAVIVTSVILPFGVLLLTSLRKAIGLPLTLDNLAFPQNYIALFEQQSLFESLWNSLWLALVATVAALAFAVLAGWLLERSKSRLRPGIQPVMLAPLAFPGAILGIAMVIGYSAGPLWLGGTLTIMLIAYIIRVIPQSFTYIYPGFKQIGAETEEASRSLGGSWSETLRRVTIPLLRGPILSVAILDFVILFRELDISIFLYTGANPVAPVVLFDLATQSRFQVMGAFAVIILIINVGVVLLARRLLRVRL